MHSTNQFCTVCGQSTSLFNYGAMCCSACSSFFRRSLSVKTPLRSCQNSELCFKQYNRAVYAECKFCRFHKCVQVGMLNTQKYSDLPKLMHELSHLDEERKKKTVNMTIPECFDLSSIFNYTSIKFAKKSPNLHLSSHDWGCMHQLTSMEFIKTFQFIKFLSMQDLKIFLKRTHFNHVLFSTAMASFSCKQDFMSFPDGTDVFPESIANVTCYNPHFLNRIRCKLMARMIELNITTSEYLLLSAIIFCNSVSTDLSENGRTLINSYQKVYGSLLFQYCEETNQKNGPLRFSELLSVCHAVAKTHEDIKKFFLLFQVYQPEAQPVQLHQDVIEYLSM
ncbi:hypothetical protein GCK72_024962 [Caenorhabditis remanei]|uniref:Nuclear Hormone Receptor family n=1 Tax=Caenorhabditis remanei TaxID=31234 RepID=A0A6A5G1G2_CAERE|nr:hypothetical protein GCK72_024962 [Caenorhabditis remanei]KAF1748495.1 hypothetical protein GCK72_024962 [Caenorhabditis remanei]